MNRAGWAALALACVLAACVRTSDGVPVAGEQAVTAASPAPSATLRPSEEADLTAPGVVPTTRAPVAPGTVACTQAIKAPVRMTAQVDELGQGGAQGRPISKSSVSTSLAASNPGVPVGACTWIATR